MAPPREPHIPTEGAVHTDVNLSGFLTWLRTHATKTEVDALLGRSPPGPLQIYIILHAGGGGAPAPKVYTQYGEQVEVPERDCEQGDTCPRCRERRGGYSFRHLDPRWTAQAAYDPWGRAQPAAMWRAAADHCWPVGLLGQAERPPQGGAYQGQPTATVA